MIDDCRVQTVRDGFQESVGPRTFESALACADPPSDSLNNTQVVEEYCEQEIELQRLKGIEQEFEIQQPLLTDLKKKNKALDDIVKSSETMNMRLADEIEKLTDTVTFKTTQCNEVESQLKTEQKLTAQLKGETKNKSVEVEKL